MQNGNQSAGKLSAGPAEASKSAQKAPAGSGAPRTFKAPAPQAQNARGGAAAKRTPTANAAQGNAAMQQVKPFQMPATGQHRLRDVQHDWATMFRLLHAAPRL